MTAEFDPSDYPGEVVAAFVAVCAEQYSPHCMRQSGLYYWTAPSNEIPWKWPNPWPDGMGEWLESNGWVYNDEGWTCPTCMAALLKEAEEDDE